MALVCGCHCKRSVVKRNYMDGIPRPISAVMMNGDVFCFVSLSYWEPLWNNGKCYMVVIFLNLK